MHTEKLKSLSNTARIASEKCKSLEVKEFPGLIVYPENILDAEIELVKRVESNETLGIKKNIFIIIIKLLKFCK